MFCANRAIPLLRYYMQFGNPSTTIQGSEGAYYQCTHRTAKGLVFIAEKGCPESDIGEHGAESLGTTPLKPKEGLRSTQAFVSDEEAASSLTLLLR
jgi:hypothetical protein